MDNKLTNFQIVIRGQLWVNLPVILFMLLITYIIYTYFALDFRSSVVIAFIFGWIYWQITVIYWIRWALKNQVEPERLLKLGKRSFLLWNRIDIDKVLNEK